MSEVYGAQGFIDLTEGGGGGSTPAPTANHKTLLFLTDPFTKGYKHVLEDFDDGTVIFRQVFTYILPRIRANTFYGAIIRYPEPFPANFDPSNIVVNATLQADDAMSSADLRGAHIHSVGLSSFSWRVQNVNTTTDFSQVKLHVSVDAYGRL